MTAVCIQCVCLYTELLLFTAHCCAVRGVAADAINAEVYSAASDGSIGVSGRGREGRRGKGGGGIGEGGG